MKRSVSPAAAGIACTPHRPIQQRIAIARSTYGGRAGKFLYIMYITSELAKKMDVRIAIDL
jgi:hypothetical protein